MTPILARSLVATLSKRGITTIKFWEFWIWGSTDFGHICTHFQTFITGTGSFLEEFELGTPPKYAHANQLGPAQCPFSTT